MGINKLQIQKMIREVEGKKYAALKIRSLKLNKDKITVEITGNKNGECFFLTRNYSKDKLCALYHRVLSAHR